MKNWELFKLFVSLIFKDYINFLSEKLDTNEETKNDLIIWIKTGSQKIMNCLIIKN